MKSNRRYFIAIATFALFFILGSATVFAQADKEYSLLVPISGVDPISGNDSFLVYLAAIYSFTISTIVILAIVMITIGGIQYLASGISPSQKSDAKTRISHAIGGLLLALISYLIFATINVNFVGPLGVDIELPDNDGPRATRVGGLSNKGDTDARAEFLAAGIRSDFYPPCSTGVRPCGDFAGIRQNTMDSVIRMKAACDAASTSGPCPVVLIDGTGPGHVAGSGHYTGHKVDIVPSARLIRHIRETYIPAGRRGGPYGGDRYIDPVDGSELVLEERGGNGPVTHIDKDVDGNVNDVD